ncbi:MAG: ANTAR domain-containing protein [Eubacterium sp.]|nr:ANTAR domain-containing protein [Eubacterium sp.]
MGLKERVFSVLIVSSADNFNSAMASMLPASGYQPVVYSGSISAAQRATAERRFDFIIINAPLPDDPGMRFAIDCSAAGDATVLLLIKNDFHAEVYERVSPHGVFTLPKPMSKQAMETALRWMKTAQQKVRRFEKKTTSIEDKMQEIRLVNKAKWLLIDREGLTEPEAHRRLEKEAMDRCLSKKTVAEELLRRYSQD